MRAQRIFGTCLMRVRRVRQIAIAEVRRSMSDRPHKNVDGIDCARWDRNDCDLGACGKRRSVKIEYSRRTEDARPELRREPNRRSGMPDGSRMLDRNFTVCAIGWRRLDTPDGSRMLRPSFAGGETGKAEIGYSW